MAKRDSNYNPIGGRRGVNRASSGIADWTTADAELVKRAIAEAALTGGAIRFGYSRDGGAYAIGIYGDGEPYTEFVQPAEDINKFLELVVALYETINEDRRQARISPTT